MHFLVFAINFFLHTLLVNICTCWQYFTPVDEIEMLNSPLGKKTFHSEYIYGDCNIENNPNYILYQHLHKDHMQVLGKIILREWLVVRRIPTCIKLIAMSFRDDLFKATGYNFQICVPRITYCHSRYRFKYFYLEWYIPLEFMGGMDWDIYLYGPKDVTW